MCVQTTRISGVYDAKVIGSYGRNSKGSGSAVRPEFGLGGVSVIQPWTTSWGTPREVRPTREDEVLNPSDMVAAGDALIVGLFATYLGVV